MPPKPSRSFNEPPDLTAWIWRLASHFLLGGQVILEKTFHELFVILCGEEEAPRLTTAEQWKRRLVVLLGGQVSNIAMLGF